MVLCSPKNIKSSYSFHRGCSITSLGAWKELLQALFKLVCVLTTLALVIWCAYEFNKNEDVCEVLFKTFHEDEGSVYPDMTFILPNAFNESALRTYNESLNKKHYRSFLHGSRDWTEQMLNIDFDKVNMRLNDYLIQTCFYETPKDKSAGICKNNITIKRWNMLSFAVFGLHFPLNMTLYKATIKLKNSIFDDKIRPSNGQFAVLFGYPNQIYYSVSSLFGEWPLRTNTSTKNYAMKFNLKNMEVLWKRQKTDKSCYDKDDYDVKIMETIIENAGCRPQMWTSNRSEPLCKTRESFKAINDEHLDQVYKLGRNKNYLEPCRTIEKLQIDYIEDDIPSIVENKNEEENGWFNLEFRLFINKFKEIRQVRKYSIQNLVGNAGGYIGLCLGYTLWNVPSLMNDIYNQIKT